MEFFKELRPVVDKVMGDLQLSMRENLEAQGHLNTGKLSESITYEIEDNGKNITAKMYMEDYGLSIEFGIKAEKIPYDGKSKTGAKESKYIQGLITFFRLRGLGEEEAKGAAFATANKQKREGMPTRGSSAFSPNKKRTGFIKDSFDAELPKIKEEIESKFGAILVFNFGEDLKEYKNITVLR